MRLVLNTIDDRYDFKMRIPSAAIMILVAYEADG